MSSFKFIKFCPDGSREYFLAASAEGSDDYGMILYKENGPAIVLGDGTEIYFTNGVKGRLNGPTVVSPTGYQEFWFKGRLGRKDGPAIIYTDGGQDWLEGNLYHRTDGPARVFADGTKQYFYKGKRIEALNDREYIRKIKLINLVNI